MIFEKMEFLERLGWVGGYRGILRYLFGLRKVCG